MLVFPGLPALGIGRGRERAAHHAQPLRYLPQGLHPCYWAWVVGEERGQQEGTGLDRLTDAVSDLLPHKLVCEQATLQTATDFDIEGCIALPD
jgi:hypothetical protein